MSLYGLEISEKAGILSSRTKAETARNCWEQLVWMPVQPTWETQQTTDAFATHGPGLLQAESLPGSCWSEYFVLHLPCEYSVCYAEGTQRLETGTVGMLWETRTVSTYLRIIFNANNSHRTRNLKGSRSQHHSPIYGRPCNIDMDDIICSFIWSIT